MNQPVSSLLTCPTRLAALAFIGAVLPMLCQCGKQKGPVKQAGAAAPSLSSESQWNTWLKQGSDPEWLKAQWNIGVEKSTKIKDSLAAIKMPEIGNEIESLKKAISAQDFSKVEELAKSIDKGLATKNMADALQFVVLQRQKGGEAASQAIEEYAGRKGLSDYERAAASSLKASMAFVQRDDVQSMLFYSIVFACDCKFGSHEGAMYAFAINSVLFPHIVFKKEVTTAASASTELPKSAPK